MARKCSKHFFWDKGKGIIKAEAFPKRYAKNLSLLKATRCARIFVWGFLGLNFKDRTRACLGLKILTTFPKISFLDASIFGQVGGGSKCSPLCHENGDFCDASIFAQVGGRQ